MGTDGLNPGSLRTKTCTLCQVCHCLTLPHNLTLCLNQDESQYINLGSTVFTGWILFLWQVTIINVFQLEKGAKITTYTEYKNTATSLPCKLRNCIQIFLEDTYCLKTSAKWNQELETGIHCTATFPFSVNPFPGPTGLLLCFKRAQPGRQDSSPG